MIDYHPGKTNVVADALSRKSVTPQNPGVPLTTVNLRKPVCLIS